MRKSKRTLSKSKMYGFNPWGDQVDAINVIITKTGEKEATILRKLVDEALTARRLKEAGIEPEESSPSEGIAEVVQTIQALLLKLVRQGDTSLRMGDVSLALLQDTLAEARAGRRIAWENASERMKHEGSNSGDIAKRFDSETAEAKKFAYRAAKQIKREKD